MAEFMMFATMMIAMAFGVVYTARTLTQPKLKPQPIKVETERQRQQRRDQRPGF